MIFRPLRSAVAAAALLVVVPIGSAVADHTDRTDPPDVFARFEGRWINLSEDWDEAHACTIAPDGARCYRSEAEMDANEGGIEPGEAAPRATCASKLRLYDGTSYGGDVLELQTRGVYLNLSSYSFDNKTSSYKIGGCSSSFYDTTTGSGLYPGNTGANVWASSMQSGWNNRIGSVYIY